MAFQMIRSRNYTFPVLIAKPELESIFNINAVPEAILIKDDKIIFIGLIFLADKVIDEELKK